MKLFNIERPMECYYVYYGAWDDDLNVELTYCATTHSNDIKVFYKWKEKQKTRKGIVQILFGIYVGKINRNVYVIYKSLWWSVIS